MEPIQLSSMDMEVLTLPMSPSFSTTRAVWLEQGGVFALANISAEVENMVKNGTKQELYCRNKMYLMILLLLQNI